MTLAFERLLGPSVAAIAFVAFLPALQAGFTNWDDQANILTNQAFRGLGFTQLRWMFTTTLLGHYIPLTWLSLSVNHALGGLNPWGYHLGNVLLHAASVAVLCRVAHRILAASFAADPPPSLALSLGAVSAALTFGLHPLRVESVAWVTERRDVLCGLFYLLAVLAYLRGVAEHRRLRGRWLVLSLLAFAGALLSKAIVMTLPVSLLLLDVYPLRRVRQGWRAIVLEKVPFAVLGAAGAAMAVFAVSRGATWTGYEEHGPLARVAMVAYSLWFYPATMIWPVDLSPLYALPRRVDLAEARFALPAVASVLVTAALVVVARWFPGGLGAWLHSAVVLAPVSGIVHAGHQLAHDRYSYLSGLGFAVVAGAGVTWVLRERARGGLRAPLAWLVVAVTVAAFIGWGAATWKQTKIWHDSESLWRAAVAVDPSCAICLNNLGDGIVHTGVPTPARLQEAEATFREAIGVDPGRSDPYMNLGALLVRQGRRAEAEAVYLEVWRRWPSLAKGPLRLGMLRMDEGRVAEALPLLRAALRLGPEARLTRDELARALASLGEQRLAERRFPDAAANFLESLRLRPNDLEPLRGLGQALVEQGRAQEAVAPLRQARVLNPLDPRACFWLARAYLETGDRALADAEIAILRKLDATLADGLGGAR